MWQACYYNDCNWMIITMKDQRVAQVLHSKWID